CYLLHSSMTAFVALYSMALVVVPYLIVKGLFQRAALRLRSFRQIVDVAFGQRLTRMLSQHFLEEEAFRHQGRPVKAQNYGGRRLAQV
ncbi:MAG: hypothetical protein WBR21_22230, partial [Rouxiella badensis]|uniref:hypothetical protein n=1 Tax=Rouxiella badensis TaxID=1646377 RepID=UPI003C6177B2